MSHNSTQLINSFVRFSEESIDWCVKQSEQEVVRIYDVLKNLLEDSKRRIHLNHESEKRYSDLVELLSNDASGQSLTKTVDLLKNLNREDRELTDPIIEALQFQDRLKQKLENLVKMLDIWNKFRGDEKSEYLVDSESLISFGEELKKCCTTPEERDTLKKYIPGLTYDEEVKGSVMF